MNVIVNGKPQEFPRVNTVGDLLQALDADARRVAVVVNNEVVPAQERNRFAIQDGDRVEILIFVGGG